MCQLHAAHDRHEARKRAVLDSHGVEPGEAVLIPHPGLLLSGTDLHPECVTDLIDHLLEETAETARELTPADVLTFSRGLLLDCLLTGFYAAKLAAEADADE